MNNSKIIISKILKNLQSLIGIKKYQNVTSKNVVLITGCDSGLGYNLSLFCKSLDMTVISGCQNINSDGAKLLRNSSESLSSSSLSSKVYTIELDLLNQDTIVNLNKFIKELLRNNNDYKFTALINNAGCMCFGEFEWQTNKIFEKQIQINLIGTMKLTKELLPLIREYKSRIINVTSHCGLEALPGLAPYAASKSGLKFWNDALRIELKKYDINVINFIPGSFVMQSNIAAKQQEYANEMRQSFTNEQENFYGNYFDEYNAYLKYISEHKKPIEIIDKKLFEKFKDALLLENPKIMYKHEPWRYTIYHFLFKMSPIFLKDWLIERFVSMPKYKSSK